MAFGLIHWLISSVLFLIVLTIITWSAVHLGRRDKNATDMISKFLDKNDYLIEGENLTIRVTESSDGLMLPAHDQGFEAKDSEEFFKLAESIRSTGNSIVNSTKVDTTTAIFTRSIVSNDSTWSENTTMYNSPDTSVALNNYQNISIESINL